MSTRFLRWTNKPGSTVGALGLAGLISYLVAASQDTLPRIGLESIRLPELQEKVVYLSSTEMKGRANGSPELRMAAEYIAEGFQKAGIKPAGDRQTFFQNFEMFISRLGQDNRLSIGGSPLLLGLDFVPHYLSPDANVGAPLTFVGYGVVAPHLRFDELAGVALKGRIAVVIDRNPRASDFASPFNRIHPSDLGSISTKVRHLKSAGAVGLLVIQNPDVPDFSIAQLQQAFSPTYPQRFAQMGNMSDPGNPEIPVVILSWNSGRTVVDGLSVLKQRIDATLTPQSVELNSRANLSVDVDRRPFPTQNVLGFIEGSDPQLRGEAVMIGAHYDHDGEADGQIWYGADDNASGTAALIELAEAFGSLSRAPRRSIVLAAFAGEEKGQIGSHHYVAYPFVSLDRTVAMFQLDMIGRNEEHPPDSNLGLDRETSAGNANHVNVIGSTFSPDFAQDVREANGTIGLTLEFRYDQTREVLLRRSDQWPFLQKKIPALFIHTGEHPDYHRPTDTADKINYPKLEKIVRLVYLAAERIANASSRPQFSSP